MAENKKEAIRKQNISARDKLEISDLLSRSECISDKLEHLDCIKKAGSIMCFVSFGSEVDTHGMIKSWLAQGKKVCVPLVVKACCNEKYMVAVQIKEFAELSPGHFGILEPPFLEQNIIKPEKIDVVIVPGSAFDIKKNRIGYGGGFYDIFLKDVSDRCAKIGICFDLQVQEEIPAEEFDIPVDILVTEKRIII